MRLYYISSDKINQAFGLNDMSIILYNAFIAYSIYRHLVCIFAAYQNVTRGEDDGKDDKGDVCEQDAAEQENTGR